MINKFCKKPLWECTRELVDAANGKLPAELIIVNAKLVNVCTHEILEGYNVSVRCGRIYLVNKDLGKVDYNTKIIDANGAYLAPAFMDGHIHIESSMMTAGEFAKSVIPHGTSGVFFDPHEICNVLGLKGIRYMLDDAHRTPLKAMLTTPSCVPAVPGFEDTGASVGPADIAEVMNWDECVGLGEMMNFPGILASDENTHAIVSETLKTDKCVTGHFPTDGDVILNAYIASGIRCCHESVTEEQALEKMRLGMYAQLREGSAWHNLKEVAKAITKHEVDSRFANLICDDIHPQTLVCNGHLDYVLRRAVEEGIDPISAIQMVTINTATCFHLDHEMGSIAPGKCADMVLIDNLKDFHIQKVFIDGEMVAENGKLLADFGPYSYPEEAKHTVHLDKITKEDITFKAEGHKVKVHVIEITPANTITNDIIETLAVKHGEILPNSSKDIMKAVVFERHNHTGKKGFGFIKGFGIKDGALAQTVAHDAHNLLVVGTNDDDMVLAANTLIECGGGACVVKDGKVLALLPLPIAGLMNDELNAEEMMNKVATLSNAWKEIGCVHPSPFMTMGIISLACIPTLRLTNRGYVDCINFKFVDLIEK